MIRSRRRAVPLAAALLPLGAFAPALFAPTVSAAPAIRAPFHRERDSLVLEDVPPLDASIAVRLERYANAREASFLDWLPDGSMLVGTRFGNAAQVHRVAAPLGMREQLTWYAEPVTAAAAPQTAAAAGFAFLKDDGGDGIAQVYYEPLSGHGDGARLLTDGKSVHGGLVWSKDGRRLAFYGNERDGSTFDIYVAEPASGMKPRLLVAGTQGLWRPLDWSPDGGKLLVEQSVSAADSTLYLADAVTGALTPVDPTGPGAASARRAGIREARFAPDGRGIYLASDAAGEFAVLRRIDLVTHESRDITASIPWDIDDFDVSADGRYVAYVVNDDGRSRLTVLDTLRRLELSPPGLPDGVIGSLRFDRTGRRLALSAESPVTPRDVYVFDIDRNAVVRWTYSEPGPVCAGAPAAEGPASACKAFVPAELIHFPTWDRAAGGRRMLSAFVYRPRAGGPHPVLIDLHGGPDGQYRPSFDPFVQFLVNELGYVVVAPNVRGSAGYGKTFLALDNGVLREDAVRDIGSLLVWIGLQSDLDRARVAVMGDAYGGYLALASLAEYNDRLRGAIDVAGISSFITFLQHTPAYRRDERRAEYGDERDPTVHEFLSRISPISRAKWIRRPLLVVQGLNDPRVPASESTQLIASLRARGNEVWYLAAKDEGHGFARKEDRDAYYEVAAMFLKRLAAGT